MAQQIQQVIKALKLDSLDSNQSLVFIKQKTHLRPSQVAFAIIVFLTIVLVIAQASTLVICIGCFLIPAYFSFNSLEYHDHKLNVKYLTYWVVFTATQVVSFIFQWIFGSTIYSLIRVALTVAMLHPQIQLSQKIYYSFIAPYIMGYEKSIDQKLEDIQHGVQDKFDQLAKKAQNSASDAVRKMQ